MIFLKILLLSFSATFASEMALLVAEICHDCQRYHEEQEDNRE